MDAAHHVLASTDPRAVPAAPAVIDRALGVLMAHHHCPADHAFDILHATAEEHGLTLLDAAEHTLATATDPPHRPDRCPHPTHGSADGTAANAPPDPAATPCVVVVADTPPTPAATRAVARLLAALATDHQIIVRRVDPTTDDATGPALAHLTRQLDIGIVVRLSVVPPTE